MAISYSTSADTVMATSAAQTVKRWEAQLIRDVYDKGFYTKFMGKGRDYIIDTDEKFMKDAGDQAKFDLAVTLTGSGVTGTTQLVDAEERMEEAQDTVTIQEIRHAVRSGSRMARQRPAFWKSGSGDIVDKYREDAKSRLGDWAAERVLDTKIANFLCGNTNETFGQTASAPSTGRVLYGGSGTATNDLTAADKFSLDMLDDAVTMAKVRTANDVPRIKPAKVKGLSGKHFISILHPYQVRDMRQNTTTGQWLDITKAAGLRGDVNKIFAGVQANFVGYYNSVAIFEHDSLYTPSTWGAGGDVEGATGLFLGAQAMIFCWASYPDWVEEFFDYKAKFGVATRLMFGADKTRFTAPSDSTAYDFATIALQTAAAS